MNLSGQAVSAFFKKFPPREEQRLIVVHDDLEHKFGNVRIKYKYAFFLVVYIMLHVLCCPILVLLLVRPVLPQPPYALLSYLVVCYPLLSYSGFNEACCSSA